jgi:hypothetical protein
MNLTTEQVWKELKKQVFVVLGMVTARGEARTAGVVYVVHGRTLHVSSQKSAWKTRHIAQNPHVSLTVPIHKRIPIMPWLKIPAATITFSGLAAVAEPATLAPELLQKLYRGLEQNEAMMRETAVITIQPCGEFITYGLGVSLMDMRQPEKARGRIAV